MIDMIRDFAAIYKDFGAAYSDILTEIYFVLDIEFNLSKQDILCGKVLSDTEIKNAEKLFIERVKTGKPIQYIVGKTFFMNDIFEVNQNVLIPRDDTQILVEQGIRVIKEYNLKSVLDIGTGSGIIAIELAKHTPASISACDISKEALKIAQKNAKILGQKIDFFKSDLFSNVSQKYDFLISNPPYIPPEMAKSLPREVMFEPSNALFSPSSGLYFYEKIINDAKKFLNPHGFIAFEIGINQANEISKMLEQKFKDIKVEKDVSGIERVIIAQLKL